MKMIYQTHGKVPLLKERKLVTGIKPDGTTMPSFSVWKGNKSTVTNQIMKDVEDLEFEASQLLSALTHCVDEETDVTSQGH